MYKMSFDSSSVDMNCYALLISNFENSHTNTHTHTHIHSEVQTDHTHTQTSLSNP